MFSQVFRSASVILPIMNETHSLAETVGILESENAADIKEYIIVYCRHTDKASLEVSHQLQIKYPQKIILLEQTQPFLGGAIQDAFSQAKGTHVVMMASDLETDPHDVKKMIANVKQNPGTIITATRWQKNAGFSGYHPLKLILNFIFQKSFSLLYWVHLSDMTYGYRLFPTSLVQAIKWEELRHPFLLETIIKPLKLNIPVIEISSGWKKRLEGESQNTFFRNFYYFPIGLKVLFYKKTDILKDTLQIADKKQLKDVV